MPCLVQMTLFVHQGYRGRIYTPWAAPVSRAHSCDFGQVTKPRPQLAPQSSRHLFVVPPPYSPGHHDAARCPCHLAGILYTFTVVEPEGVPSSMPGLCPPALRSETHLHHGACLSSLCCPEAHVLFIPRGQWTLGLVPRIWLPQPQLHESFMLHAPGRAPRSGAAGGVCVTWKEMARQVSNVVGPRRVHTSDLQGVWSVL